MKFGDIDVFISKFKRFLRKKRNQEKYRVAYPIIRRADEDGSEKCERCWRYWGIPYNIYGVCDRCAEALLENKDYRWEVRRNQIAQVYRFRSDLRLLPEDEANKQIDAIVATEREKEEKV